MTTRKMKVLRAERDRIVIAAIYRARNVMMLLHGARVHLERQHGFLDLEKDILRLTEVLRAMGTDPPFPILE